MISITDYINNKAENLKEKIANGCDLCGCRSLRFDYGNLPDYNNDLLQDVYIIRYGLAYAFEYKRMYKRLLESLTPGRTLEVTSLGCGNMVDYWSLKQVLPANCSVRYHGVDVIDWNDKFPAWARDRIDFVQEGINDYLAECDSLTSDVYVFPKSISELSKDEVEDICRMIREKGFAKNEVHFLFSMRANQYNLDCDMAKTQKISESIMELGMVPDTEACALYEGLDKMICNCDRDFSIDELNGAYNLLNNLPYMCDNYNESNRVCERCRENRTQPMLKAKYMRYQIYTFRKVA